MPIDRAATLRQAEKLLRQGKLEQAIAEYLRVAEDQPGDWNTANLLGDLYVRAGQVGPAVAQFTRIAEGLRREGFLPRASALYKKVLKLQPDSDQALVRAGELAAQQGLKADARAFFASVASLRRHRGDVRGALDVAVRVAELDVEDVPARMAGARARLELGDAPGALTDYLGIAAWLTEQARDAEVEAPLRAVLDLDPGSVAAARDLARMLVASGRLQEAAPYLTPQTIGADAGLMRLVAQIRFEQGDIGSGLELIDRMLIVDDAATAVVAEMADVLSAEHPASAWSLTERLAGVSVERADWSGAARSLRRFIERVPHHVQALMRLLDVCVDGGLRDEVADAQAMLADAYLVTGAAGEAKYVAEDLLTRQPWDRAHYARMRAALVAEGTADPDRALADWLAETPEFGMSGDGVAVGAADEIAAAERPAENDPSLQWLSPMPTSGPPSKAGSRNPHAIDLDIALGTRPVPPSRPSAVEEDLSAVLDGIRPLPPVALPPVAASAASQSPASTPDAASAPPDLESVFADMREAALQRPLEEASEMAFLRGTAMADAGELERCIEPLRLAARSPHRRFAAALLLAQVHERRQRPVDAIEWLGHAVDAPDLTDAQRFDTLLRMAELLEQAGEPASALAVCLELQSDAGEYKDLSVRIARLSRAQAGG